MSCLAWNPQKVPVFNKEVHSKGPNFIFLSETKLLSRELGSVARALGFSCCLGVDCDLSNGGRQGGLAILWKEDIPVAVRSYSSNHIDVRIGEDDGWRFTGIYGFPEDNQKWRTWRLLERLATENSMSWLCVGDYNEILSDAEKSGGNYRRHDRMLDFRSCLDQCGLFDLGYHGHKFTWTNKQSGANNIQERLDRGVANESWLSRFPRARVSHLARLLSDQCPLWVEWDVEDRRRRRGGAKLFRFETLLLNEVSCGEVVDNSWIGGGESPSLDLATKLDRCGGALSAWGDACFGNIPREVRKSKSELERLQAEEQTEATIQAIRSLENRISALVRLEEVY